MCLSHTLVAFALACLISAAGKTTLYPNDIYSSAVAVNTTGLLIIAISRDLMIFRDDEK